MQYTISRGEKGKIEIKVNILRADFLASYNKFVAEFAKDAKIAGFRPGKAPASVVEQHFGTNRILNETASFLTSKHLSEILEKEKITPMDLPKIAIDSLSHGAPFAFTATFYQKPQVKIGDWNKIRVKRVKAQKITDEDVEKSIKNIFEAWKEKKATRDKQQATNDKEEAVSVTDSGEPSKFIYDAHGKKIFIEDEELTRPRQSRDEVGKSQRVKETEEEMASGNPSTIAQDEIDDNFAKAIGAKDLAYLREVVKKDLEAIVTEGVEAKFEDELFEKIIEAGEVAVPEILVEDELNRILIRLNSQLDGQGKTLEDYLSKEKTTLDELKNKWRQQAEKNVKISLILDEIGKEEKVTVAKEEIEAALKNINRTNLSQDQKIDLERYITINIFQAKTLDLVKKTATV